jgi:tRNA threonylcarbamoyladenosine biosynthesis protein TsaB
MSSMATLLAFDTATERVSVALGQGARVWARSAAGGGQASATLLPAILGLLAEAGLQLHDLDAIAFGRGPGAFTGLRTAAAVAQGLAFGAGKPVVPVDTLLALAEDARSRAARDAPDWRVWALLDARMGEVYAAQYRWHAGAWSTLDAPLLARPQDLAVRWREALPQALAGAGLALFAAALDAGGAQRIDAAEPLAAALLRVAQARFAGGGGVDAALALPLYVRDTVAQTMAERAARASVA